MVTAIWQFADVEKHLKIDGRWRTFAMARNALAFVLIATSFAVNIVGASVALAQDTSRGDSRIKQAAIKKMQSRLGGLRGTIGIGDRYVRLTQEMIDRLKPPVPSNDRDTDTSIVEVTNSVAKPIEIQNVDIESIIRDADKMVEIERKK